MKTLLTSFSLLFVFASHAQESLLTFKRVLEVPGATKEEIFVAARKWFIQTFPQSKDKFVIEDKEAGELSARGITTIPVSYSETPKKNGERGARFNANFLFKDGKCQYEFTNIDVQKGQGNAKYNKLRADDKADQNIEAMKTGAKKHFEEAANSLKTVMDNLN